ncbi:hypothetical protein O181_040689 [Austropuccinia psidii MF-1]|uniref:Reverse transcriptase domain-containing protein n=1 Tax=Austropuccinia psidii MF-1 TaxID=1389203 RepID=A0A9Q3DCS0_9BASI|nr:hypothetical protein [Austropuccinia psidii MF-1]
MDLPPLFFHASLEEQWDEEEEPEEIENVLKVVPPDYHQYLDLFSKVKADKCPSHCACDHHIELEGLLPPKKDGGLCLCFDYRKLNAVARKNRYPFPPMNQLLTVFKGCIIFSKIDLCGAYNLLRIKEEDENLTSFRTKHGSYEYLVMPFGLTNAPASLQNLVNEIVADFLDIFVVVYFNYIIVFSSSEEEHFKRVASVLQRLRDNDFFSKAPKCVFHASSVEYFGYVLSSEGLKMDSSRVQQILNWPWPKNIKALQSFLGFANFYCCFIQNYSKKISDLTSLLKKYSPFIFNEEALKIYASDYALLAVLIQVNDSGKHPIAFDSHNLLPDELNYEIHDKELPGIVWALKCWRASLLSLSDSFEFLTDHYALQYFMSSKVLTCRQARWEEFLSEFHVSITYCPGRLATSPDVLSYPDKVYPEWGVDFISKNPPSFHQVLKQNEIKESSFFSIKVEFFL